MSNDKLAEALREAADSLRTLERGAMREEYLDDAYSVRAYARSRADAAENALQAHAAEAAHPQPAQDASKYQELLMAVEKKFPGESRHETALRYIRETELQSCEPKCDAAMAKESGR